MASEHNRTGSTEESGGGFGGSSGSAAEGFFRQQLTELTQLITSTVQAQFQVQQAQIKQQGQQPNPNNSTNPFDSVVPPAPPNVLKASDIEYFDLDYENKDFFSTSALINAERHIFYKNIYVFIDRLKNLAQIHEIFKIKKIISTYLKKIALIWHFIEFIEIKKNYYEMFR